MRWSGNEGVRRGRRLGLCLLAAGAAVLLTACAGGAKNAAPNAAAARGTPRQTASTLSPAVSATPGIVLPPVARASGTPSSTAQAGKSTKGAPAADHGLLPQLDAGQTLSALQKAGLPVIDGSVVTAANDPDARPGQPGGYASRADFLDSSLAKTGTPWSVANGGAIEVFDTTKAAAMAKKALVAAATAAGGSPSEDDYADKTIVLRLSTHLPAQQVSAYELAVKRAVQLDLKHQKKSMASPTPSPTPAPQ